MSDRPAKPIIFISYSHKDEPENPAKGQVQWLSFVRVHLQPAVKSGVFDLWVDRNMPGGSDWSLEIEQKLHECDVFILLVSPNSMASDYIVDREIAIIRKRHAAGEPVHFYPLLLTPTPKAGLARVSDKNLRPRDAKPFSGYSSHDRAQHMTDAADEIAALVGAIASRKTAALPSRSHPSHAYVHTAGLPETAYERLVGRDAELKALDEAWADAKTNVVSLIAEGGAGKSALVNEWLTRLQADNYRGAELVLGWSFYSQGSKERMTSADQFLTWALDKLGGRADNNSASARGEAIAEAMMRRRVLLLLDGVEPLQHGLDAQTGQLKDPGLRALLRRFAATPPGATHGLVVLTSRVAVKDITRWEDGAAKVVDVERLSDEAGAALLRDNGVWGTSGELKRAAQEFGGHPLALGLLASLLQETQTGDVRRRDHIRGYLADGDNPRHDHARRVMESYEAEWFADRLPLLRRLTGRFLRAPFSDKAVMRAIMHMVGLFDRPAPGDCLKALRVKPAIKGLTDQIVQLDEGEWERGIARLREVRLLAPRDPAAPDALDAHPLVREWFGERLRQSDETAWKVAHGRLYEHQRDATKEGTAPTLEELAPLYMAVAHGCRAGRQQEVFLDVYRKRLCRQVSGGTLEPYGSVMLGAVSTDLAAISWFFEQPYQRPAATLDKAIQAWLISTSGYVLSAQGRLVEALQSRAAALSSCEAAGDWRNASVNAQAISSLYLLMGKISDARSAADKALLYANDFGDDFGITNSTVRIAEVLFAQGQLDAASRLFADAERLQQQHNPRFQQLISLNGYNYCNLLLAEGAWHKAHDRAASDLKFAEGKKWLHEMSMDKLTLGRSNFGIAISSVRDQFPRSRPEHFARAASGLLDESLELLRSATRITDLPRSLLARAAFRRSVGDWERTARDLDEVYEVSDPAPMPLYLCDAALEWARLAFAKVEAFAPLNDFGDGVPKPGSPDKAEVASLQGEAAKRLATAADYIRTCGYHRRDEELAELQSVLRGERKFADLPPRV
jgi:tetratricopeptide (TPR) repeat protein